MKNISLELIRINQIHERQRLSFRESALLKVKFMAGQEPPPGVTRRNAKKRAVKAFLKGEEEAALRPIPVMGGPSEYTHRGW